MTSEAEWLGSKVSSGGRGIGSAQDDHQHPFPCADPPAPYTITTACQEVDEWREAAETTRKWWVAQYTLLAEAHEELQRQREALRERVSDLEGLRDQQFDELRQAHGEIDALRSKLDTANVTPRGW